MCAAGAVAAGAAGWTVADWATPGAAGAAGAAVWAKATLANSDAIRAAVSFFMSVSSEGMATHGCVVLIINAAGASRLTSRHDASMPGLTGAAGCMSVVLHPRGERRAGEVRRPTCNAALPRNGAALAPSTPYRVNRPFPATKDGPPLVVHLQHEGMLDRRVRKFQENDS